MSLIRKHVAVLQAWACLALVFKYVVSIFLENLYVTRYSVATQLRCGGIFNTGFIANCPRSLCVKEFLRSVNISRRYEQKLSGTFLWPTVYIPFPEIHWHLRLPRSMFSAQSMHHNSGPVGYFLVKIRRQLQQLDQVIHIIINIYVFVLHRYFELYAG